VILDIFTLLLNTYGYFGIFLINLIASLTIILPLPASIFVFASSAVLNPFVVGLSAAAGSAIGEISGYALGRGGRKVIGKKWKKTMDNTEKLFMKYGGFLIIIIFGATPLPDDIVGILAGTLKYPFKKYFIATFIGKLILNLALAYGGFYGINWVLNMFSSSA
jgi:membrane protein YqaA with SNARE-associated domain